LWSRQKLKRAKSHRQKWEADLLVATYTAEYGDSGSVSYPPLDSKETLSLSPYLSR
jgi:hypothetical protein